MTWCPTDFDGFAWSARFGLYVPRHLLRHRKRRRRGPRWMRWYSTAWVPVDWRERARRLGLLREGFTVTT